MLNWLLNRFHIVGVKTKQTAHLRFITLAENEEIVHWKVVQGKPPLFKKHSRRRERKVNVTSGKTTLPLRACYRPIDCI